MIILDPLKHGFYCVKYEYMNKQQNAVYFQLHSAQEAMSKMIKKGVVCLSLYEWKPIMQKSKIEILSIQKKS